MATPGDYRVGDISNKTFDAAIKSGYNPYTGEELKPGEAEQLQNKRNQRTKSKGGILDAVSNLFGFSKLAAAEPDKGILGIKTDTPVNQFSVTKQPQFDMKPEVNVPGNFDMRGSVIENVVDTPTREFGDMLVGRPDQAIFGSTGQRYNANNPELFFNTAAGQAMAADDNNFFDYLKDLSGGAVDFAKDMTGRYIASNVGATALSKINPILGAAAGITGLFKGGNLFDTNTLSQRRFDAMTPGQQAYTSSLYNRQPDGSLGLLQGYNPISYGGQGALGTLSNRLDTVRNTLGRQGANPSTVLQQREQQIKDAIDRSINIGEGEALGDRNRSVDYGVTGGPTRTDIDVADGGAETGGGKIVCTMMNESYGFGNFRNKIWLRQSKDLAPEYQKGYHILFLPLVKIAKTNKTIKKVLEHIAVHRTIDIRQESRGKTHILGRLYRKVLEPICYWVGKYAKR
jgi:hypothetical protein